MNCAPGRSSDPPAAGWHWLKDANELFASSAHTPRTSTDDGDATPLKLTNATFGNAS